MFEISISYVIFGSLVICLLMGIPIGFSLGIATALGLLMTRIPLVYLAETFYSGAEIFPLMAIPGFILAGQLMERSGITKKIIDVIYEIAGNVPGGIAVVTILSCMFFAALSGSGPATTAAVGSVMIPAMVNAGYSKRFASAVSSTGGTIGIMIPPSNPMIMYGVVANLSVAGLFAAGFIPGIILGLVLCLQCLITGKIKGYKATGKKFSGQRLLKNVYVGSPALFMPVMVLGSIYGGLTTPTEASILAVLYAFALGYFVYRQLTMKDLWESMVAAGLMTGAVLIIMGPAMAFGKILTMYEIPGNIASYIVSLTESKYGILFMICAFLIFVETFMETLSTIVLLTPIFLPIMHAIGVDPVHFGILFVILSEVGFLTPPLGVNLYVASGISGLSIEEISLGVLPFILVLCSVIVFFIFSPGICTWGYYFISSH
jgi:C4-dicarboxylate transporter, DctM subunit